MPDDWSPEYHHHIRPIDAPPEASQRERDQFRQNLKRVARAANGRCRCGRLPASGRKTCERCLELSRRQHAASRERARAKRDAERRAAAPRQCSHCGCKDLMRYGFHCGRQYYKCHDCARYSNGDEPPKLPSYPCPYCGGHCVKHGLVLVVRRKPQKYLCRSCGRSNTNLYPESGVSPGGPFPHTIHFGLSYPARDALVAYCQKNQMSIAQAVRDIFILAAKVPPTHVSVGRGGYEFQSPAVRAYLAAAARRSAPLPTLPTIPPGGIALPSACPAAMAKLKLHRTGRYFNPTVLVAIRVTVCLSDLALASLLEMMRRRNMNHQDTARALIAEANHAHTPPIIAVGHESDLDDGW